MRTLILVSLLLDPHLTYLHSVRSPTADLPNTAALLGGFIAQEVIKLITKQYIPMSKYCVIDLIGSTTGMIP